MDVSDDDSSSWQCVFINDDGIPKAVVKDDNFQNITNFMTLIEECQVGAAEGVFKVSFDEASTSATSLPKLIKIITPVIDHNSLQEQIFSRARGQDSVFGYLQRECSDSKLLKVYKKAVLTASSYEGDTCCTRKLKEGTEALLKHYAYYIDHHSHKRHSPVLALSQSRMSTLAAKGEELREMYMNFVNQKSAASSLLSIMREAKEAVHDLPSHCACEHCCNCERCERQSEDSDESDVKKDYVEYILYASALDPKEKIWITPKFSLSDLNSILNFAGEVHPGVHTPYLYSGVEHSTFPAHIEDGALWSINYMQAGHPKIWVVIAPSEYKRFDSALSRLHLELPILSCRNLMTHKYVVMLVDSLKRLSIRYSLVVQRPGDFVIVYPNAIHMGFNTGPNLAEAVNFATVSWIPLFLAAPKCGCNPDVSRRLHLDVRPILLMFRPDLLEDFVNGVPFVETEEVVATVVATDTGVEDDVQLLSTLLESGGGADLQKLPSEEPAGKDTIAGEKDDTLVPGEFPSVNLQAYFQDSEKSILDVDLTGGLHFSTLDVGTVMQEIQFSDLPGDLAGPVGCLLTPAECNSAPQDALHVVNPVAPLGASAVCARVATPDSPPATSRKLLNCPAEGCGVSYVGGKGRLDRLEKHIEKKHLSEAPALLNVARTKYAIAPRKHPPTQTCPICAKRLAGSSTHLQEHINRKHKT